MTNGRCFQSEQVNGVCDVCNEPAIHVPEQPLGFFYCELHCPVCSNYFDVSIIAIAGRRSGVCLSVKGQHPYHSELFAR